MLHSSHCKRVNTRNVDAVAFHVASTVTASAFVLLLKKLFDIHQNGTTSLVNTQATVKREKKTTNKNITFQ